MAMENQPALPSLDVWTSALLSKSTAGRGSNGELEAYGIKKLRELILELAVRGKLVPQDPNDEPIEESLARIVAQKTSLLSSGDIKKSKTSQGADADTKIFGLPTSWQWCPLEELLDVNWGNTSLTKSSYSENGVIAFSAAGPDGFISHAEFNCEGVVISAIGARCGRCFAANGKWTAIKNTMTVVPYDGTSSDVNMKFILVALSLPETFPRRGGAQPFLSLGDVRAALIPLPPVAEQHRIVAKVDEFMALCDQLEQQQTDSLAAHQTLVETLLGTLTQPAVRAELVEARPSTVRPFVKLRAHGSGRTDFEEAWARIAIHFDTLFTTEASIDQLKQTLLQLAVMGKLVPQDPNDEPVNVLLEIDEKDMAFNLPDGWQWTRLNSLLPEFQNGASSRGDKNGKDVVVLRLADIENWKVSLRDTRMLTISEVSIDKYALQQGDVLVIRVNGSADIVGRFVLCNENIKAIYCDHFIRMRITANAVFPEYLALLGSSDLIRDQIEGLFVSTAGQKTVNQKHIGSLVITLPPLAEQHRIVAKVDELMALCDALKARIKDAQTTQIHLADAIVEQAVA